MPIRALDAAASAMMAFSTAQAVSAHNVANMNTEGFDPSRVTLEDRPDQGGVAVQEIRQLDVQGPMVPSAVPGVGYAEGSGTDLAREMVLTMANERAVEASAAVVRTADDMLGTLLDEVV
ncbi:flagellar basal body rod C-terminal domain-containing protein [Desulfocurvus vexinensis]|uniref:flagellar basal body rod C-terminal domain-containing protein n=1 Tax=Desulfocurvus vexinensis TaxID=399548 RepID=UPI00048E81AC|nr:flagellar basal body rod C-terminal domain-containing protein [Desulfocurvus vexinensis]